MNHKLKSCPFCGGEGRLITSHLDKSPKSWVICISCGAGTKECYIDYFNFIGSKDAAVNIWNKRNEVRND